MFDKINQDLIMFVIVTDNHFEEENSNALQIIVHSHTSIHLFLLNNRKSNRDLKRKKSIYESLYNMIKWQLGCLKQEGFFKAPFYSNILPLEKHISLESQNEVMQQWCCTLERTTHQRQSFSLHAIKWLLEKLVEDTIL